MTDTVRILCVDDERNVLRALERLFLDDPYEILTAGSGEEGLRLLESNDIQVVVSDYRMPGMNGVDFLKQVYARWPDTVRIVLSGYADTVAVVEAINEGQIYKFMPKPWNDDELRVNIANAVERYELARKNISLQKELQEKNLKLERLADELAGIAATRTAEILYQQSRIERQMETEADRRPPRTAAEHILGRVPMAVLALSAEGDVLYVNPAGWETLAAMDDPIGKNRDRALQPLCNAMIDRMLESMPPGNLCMEQTETGRTLLLTLSASEGPSVILIKDLFQTQTAPGFSGSTK